MGQLDAYETGVHGPWGLDEAGHLFRRAAFGGTPAERAAAVGDGGQQALIDAVDALVGFAPDDPALDVAAGVADPTFGDPIPDLPDAPAGEEDTLGAELAAVKNPLTLRQLQAHWLYRMRYTSQPLQEQLALFLHDHMVSHYGTTKSFISTTVNLGNDGSVADQRCTTGTLPPDPLRRDTWAAALTLDQTYLFRHIGADSYRDLLIAVTRDPAMLIYLDNVVNKKGKPQENFAREVLELFSMGEGNYSEQDIREIAKCFTGETIPAWHSGSKRACEFDFSLGYGFDPAIHEPGPKNVFGAAIPEDMTGQETLAVLDLVLGKVSVNPNAAAFPGGYQDVPATAVYMSWKLLTWFVNHEIELLPTPDPVVLELADYMRGDDGGAYPQRRFPYDLRACLRKLFLSQYFFDAAHRFAMHKTPVEYIVSALKALDLDELYSDDKGPTIYLRDMGMELFQPPDVSGWRHGQSWTSSGTLLERFQYAKRLAYTLLDSGTEYGAYKLGAFLTANGGTIQGYDDHAGIVDCIDARMFHGALTVEERAALLAAVEDVHALMKPEQALDGYYFKMNAAIFLALTMHRFQLK